MGVALPEEEWPNEVAVQFSGGTITFCGKKRAFEVVRGSKEQHDRCRFTRANRVTPSSMGRPSGEIALWLVNDSQAMQCEHVYAPHLRHSQSVRGYGMSS